MTFAILMITVSCLWFAKQIQARPGVMMLVAAADLVLGGAAIGDIWDINPVTTPELYAYFVTAMFVGLVLFLAGVAVDMLRD